MQLFGYLNWHQRVFQREILHSHYSPCFWKAIALPFRGIPRLSPHMNSSFKLPSSRLLSSSGRIESQRAFFYSLVTSKTSPPIIVLIPVCRKPLPVKSVTVASASSPRDPSSQDSSWPHHGINSSAALPLLGIPGSVHNPSFQMAAPHKAALFSLT